MCWCFDYSRMNHADMNDGRNGVNSQYDNVTFKKVVKNGKWWKKQFRRPQNYSNFIIWVIATTLIVLTEYGYIPGTKLGFTCGDPLFSHKYMGEVITPEILGTSLVIVAFLVILITELTYSGSLQKCNTYLMWYFVRQILIGGTFTLFLTEMGKTIVAEHRPHFFDVCQPDTAKNCTPGEYVFNFKCTNTEYRQYFLVDTSRSFPSGHASTSVFTGIFCSYILHRRLTPRLGLLMKPFLMATVLTWALLCSLTRITDRRHHWWDVLVGSALGIAVAFYFIKITERKVKQFDIIENEETGGDRNAIMLNVRENGDAV